MHQTKPLAFACTSFPLQNSLIIPSFDVICTELIKSHWVNHKEAQLGDVLRMPQVESNQCFKRTRFFQLDGRQVEQEENMKQAAIDVIFPGDRSLHNHHCHNFKLLTNK
jgi:hypothetical protein